MAAIELIHPTSIKMEWTVFPDKRDELLAELMEVIEAWAEETDLSFDLRID